MELIQALEELLKEFRAPFLPSGFVGGARVDEVYGEPALNIWIGDRDITILGSGEIMGTGMGLGPAAEWDVRLKK